MSKIKKTDLLNLLQEQAEMIVELSSMIKMNKQSIIKLENGREKPKLKQLDQSVFDGLDEKWRFAAVDGCTSRAYVYEQKPHIMHIKRQYWRIDDGLQHIVGDNYDTSNWQNSLIERESKELTGSDYYHSRIASHLLEFGHKLVVCFASNISEADALSEKRIEVITSVDTEFTDADEYGWQFVVPINNQGEPLTASEVGL